MLTVVYLIYGPMGSGPVSRFADSYLRHPAGRSHDLLVAVKGGGPGASAPLRDIPRRTIYLPDEGFDIDAYFASARACPPGAVLFLNTASELLDGGWLASFEDALSPPGVGAVSATGSFESHYEAEAVRVSPRHPRTYLKSIAGRVRSYLDCPPFPNPHLRTNAFMLERDLLLSLSHRPDGTKRGALLFESGRRGMTAQLDARGLDVRVVGRDGRAYEARDWPCSGTFRCGRQGNLLVADNRTREYDDADPARRAELRRLAWGEDDGGGRRE